MGIQVKIPEKPHQQDVFWHMAWILFQKRKMKT